MSNIYSTWKVARSEFLIQIASCNCFLKIFSVPTITFWTPNIDILFSIFFLMSFPNRKILSLLHVSKHGNIHRFSLNGKHNATKYNVLIGLEHQTYRIRTAFFVQMTCGDVKFHSWNNFWNHIMLLSLTKSLFFLIWKKKSQISEKLVVTLWGDVNFNYKFRLKNIYLFRNIFF